MAAWYHLWFGLVSVTVFLVGNTKLLCKGAETAIFERVVKGEIEMVETHINDFAKARNALICINSSNMIN